MQQNKDESITDDINYKVVTVAGDYIRLALLCSSLRTLDPKQEKNFDFNPGFVFLGTLVS
jgi:hypothetical protein